MHFVSSASWRTIRSTQIRTDTLYPEKADEENDLRSAFQLNDQGIQLQKQSVKPLGVWFDPKMRWNKEERMITRAKATLASISHMANSMFGPSTACRSPIYRNRSKQLFYMELRNGHCHSLSQVQNIRRIRNKCFQQISGGYGRTPTMLLERGPQ